MLILISDLKALKFSTVFLGVSKQSGLEKKSEIAIAELKHEKCFSPLLFCSTSQKCVPVGV